MKYKIMKLICMFDLPVETDEQKRVYRQFRKNLIKEGFSMIQYSVYVRTCQNSEHSDRVVSKIQKIVPQNGNVRLLSVTEKQYNDMRIFVGSKTATENAYKTERFIVL